MKELLSILPLLLLLGCPKSTEDTGVPSNGYHPDGWSDPAQHGPAAKMQDLLCVSCHGEDLAGGSAGTSCDLCHPSGWRTDCVFCHGGGLDSTGAPPVDFDNLSEDLSFPEHGAHVNEGIHAAWDCGQCHVKPADVLSTGHFLIGDTSPGTADVTFAGGLSPAGTYTSGTCANLYCHGDGRTAGTVSTGVSTTCASCHGDLSSAGRLSGRHADHLGEGVSCEECHADTVSNPSTISDPAQHVDGEVDLAFPSGMNFNGASCAGSCHGEDHEGRSWTGGGD